MKSLYTVFAVVFLLSCQTGQQKNNQINSALIQQAEIVLTNNAFNGVVLCIMTQQIQIHIKSWAMLQISE